MIRNINIKFTRFAQNLHVLFYGFERNGITKNRKKQATKEKELTKWTNEVNGATKCNKLKQTASLDGEHRNSA